MEEQVINAVARVDASGKRSTAFVVGDRWLLTAMHAVGNRSTRTLLPPPYELTLRAGTATASVHGTYWDPVAD